MMCKIFCGSCLASLEPRLKGRKIKIDIPPNLPLIPMDSVLLAQVLINLMDNSLKYSPADGTLEVTGRIREISKFRPGPGIPKSIPETGFDKFFRISHNEEVSGT